MGEGARGGSTTVVPPVFGSPDRRLKRFRKKLTIGDVLALFRLYQGSLEIMANAVKSWFPLEVTSLNAAGCGPVIDPEMIPSTTLPWRDKRKVLILDDDREFLDLYKKIIGRLPCRPDVQVADTGARALVLLDAEPFELFITDLRMPKIDGFQVLLSARRRFPDLKLVVITGAGNEQYRARAYASGIDLYTEKPTTPAEIRIFGECVEALLLKGEKDGGFRGIQSKSLMDLVQIECLSRNSSLLRITRGSLEGRIWILNGNVIDAEAGGMRGEEAFKHVFAWKTGNFELLPGDPDRERTIFNSHESLLLDSAQMLDEAIAAEDEAEQKVLGISRDLKPLATVRGVESLLLIDEDGKTSTWGVANPEGFAAWTHRVLRDFQGLGEMLKAGPLKAVEAAGPVRGVALLTDGARKLMAGMDRKMTVRFIRRAGMELASFLQRE